MPPYVILEHTGSQSYKPGVHWDLMLEDGGRLRTWELDGVPAAGVKLHARPLHDHRLDYLQYDGPVSGDRGDVHQWDAGDFETKSETGSEIALRLSGKRLMGNLNLIRDPAENDRWWATFDAR